MISEHCNPWGFVSEVFDVETKRKKKREAKLVKGIAVECLLIAYSSLGKKLNKKIRVTQKSSANFGCQLKIAGWL